MMPDAELVNLQVLVVIVLNPGGFSCIVRIDPRIGHSDAKIDE